MENGPALIKTRFGRLDGCDPELKKVADEITYRGIKVMLDVSIYSFWTRSGTNSELWLL